MNKENIIIRDPKKTDIDQVLIYINKLSKEKTFVILQGLVMSRKLETDWLKSNIENIKNKKSISKFIFDKDKLIGISSVKLGGEKTSEEHIGTFGISVDKQYRGKGLGKMLMNTVLQESEKRLKGLKIIYLEAFSENVNAIKMYENFGFIKCGLLPGGVKRKGKCSDMMMMYKKVK